MRTIERSSVTGGGGGRPRSFQPPDWCNVVITGGAVRCGAPRTMGVVAPPASSTPQTLNTTARDHRRRRIEPMPVRIVAALAQRQARTGGAIWYRATVLEAPNA